MKKQEVVTLQYDDLKSFDPNQPNQGLVNQIQQAYGPDGLGILLVLGVPGFEALRQDLLPLSAKLPGLPEVTEKCVDEKSSYSTGWSHGKEQLAPGKPDTAKGSFYGNPLAENLVPLLAARNERDESYWQAQAEQHPEFYAPNLWPNDTLPELESAFCAMGKVVASTGQLVAAVCDAYCRQHGVETSLADLLLRSLNAKGRLLHYFDTTTDTTNVAEKKDEKKKNDGEEEETLWCGWHNDHGSLTGLVPAMYLDRNGEQVPCPSDSAGLYIQARSGEIIRASLPPHALGFQIGETSQIQSGGLLRATPHAVKSSSVPGITRESFAVFLEPEFDAPLAIPANKTLADCTGPPAKDSPPSLVPLDSRWKPGQTFGDFHVATVSAFLARDEEAS